MAVLALAVALAVTALGLSPAPVQASDWMDVEQRLVSEINREREAEGQKALAVNWQMVRIARDWSDAMRDEGVLRHNQALAESLTGDWQRVGENVGYSRVSGYSEQQLADRLHNAFMDSPAHRVNVLGDFNQVGVGVRVDGSGKMWVTVNFLKGAEDGFPVFSDTVSNPHRDNIDRLFISGVTKGCGQGQYCSARALARDEMASFLARVQNLDQTGSSSFSDVGATAHTGAIAALQEAGITNGCNGGGEYCPKSSVTRGEMASFLARSLGLDETGRATDFSDVGAAYTHSGAIQSLKEAGITNGHKDGTYRPQDKLSRAEMASFLVRAFDL